MIEFCLGAEDRLGFNDKTHANNYTKYLFSESAKHSHNNLTKNNLIYCKGDIIIGDDIGQPPLKKALKILKEYDFKELDMNIGYILYIYKLGNNLVSNFIDGNELVMDDYIYSSIIDTYFYGDEPAFQNKIEEVVNSGYELIKLSKLNTNHIQRINNYWLKKYKSENDIIFAIHNDQDSHAHFHTLSLVEL